jgi:hypothetical protein
VSELSYINEFFRLRCAEAFCAFGIFPNAKEVTESFGAYHAVRKHLPHLAFKDPSVTMIAVGDGCTPRTGSTFALRSAWTCHSVDPACHETSKRGPQHRPASHGWGAIRRLTVHAKRIEDVYLHARGPVVIVAVHSHARLEAAVQSVCSGSSLSVIAMPCCKPQRLHVPPDIEYEDEAVLSPRRRILVWKDVPR